MSLPNMFGNLFFIMFPLFIYQIWQNHFLQLSKERQHLLLALTTGCSAVLCMSFPVDSLEQRFFDFRMIPLVIGGLYGNRKVLFFLFSLVIAYRYTMGGVGFEMTAVSLVLLLPVILLISKRLIAGSLKIRVISVIFITSLPTILFLVYGGIEYPFNNPHTVFALEYFVTTVTMTWLVLFFIEKIRENNHIQEQIAQAEKIQAVSELAASVSHEVRNPLTVTRGFLQLLLKTENNPKNIEYLGLALEELDRAKNIITDYLTYAKPELAELEQLRVADEIHYVCNVMQPFAHLNQVELMSDNLDDAVVLGRQALFRQCLVNICKNSIEAMPTGGNLSISAKRCGQDVHITITDTGTGMSQEQLNRIGKPYYTTKEKGTGLGTMVSLRIIETMNGTIQINSAPDVGTTVKISLPILQAAQSFGND